MKGLWLPLIFVASPALAHHEVVVATTVLPAMSWLAVVASAGAVSLLRWWRGKRH